MACHAEHLLHQAVTYDSLAAVRPCHWVGRNVRRVVGSIVIRHDTPANSPTNCRPYLRSIRTSGFSLVQRTLGLQRPSWTSVMTLW